jgi:sulfane dehydrogenase subunit SoxC
VKSLYEPGTESLMKAVAEEASALKGQDRREFLRKGLAVAAGVTAGAAAPALAKGNPADMAPNVPSWTKSLGRGVVARPYGRPSDFTDLQRRTVPWLTASPESSISFSPLQDLKGIITPSGLHFERYHGGIPEVNPDSYQLMIHGLVDRPLIFTMEDLLRMPSVSEIRFIECPANGGMEWKGAQMEALQFTHGMISCSEWTGVRLSTLLDYVGVKPEGKWILAEGSDASGMSRSIPMEKALDDVMVCYAQNGEPLRPEQGYPVRLMVPGWEGNVSIKWLRRIEVGDQPWYHREETSKYTDLMPDGRSRKFTFVQEANSVVTNPCPENPIRQKGFIEIEGLAWSGRGTIKAVDLSFDGGVTWKQAEIKGIALPKALTRFSFKTEWNGEEWMLQSRAVDDTGYVQPTLAQLREARGVNSIYHKNSIHTWNVHANGEVHNVQIS